LPFAAAFASPVTSASAGTPSGSTSVMTPLSARLCPMPCAAPRPCRSPVHDLVLA
jgi:hypothetical protein